MPVRPRDLPGASATVGGTELRREAQLFRRVVIGAAVATVAALPFLALLLLVRTGYAPLASVDGALAEGLNGWARERPDVVVVLELLSHVTSPWTFRALVLLAAGVLWQYRRRRLATWALMTMTVGGVLAAALKLVVARARPAFDEPVFFAEGLSFPSGHALNSMLCSAVLLLMVLPVLSRRGRVLAWMSALGAVLVTGFDRIALGAHFLTDVLAGWALALALVVGTGTAFGTWRRQHPALLDSEQAQRNAHDLHLRASLHEAGRLLGRALSAGAVMVAVMIALGLLVTGVLNELPALDGLNELTRRLAADRTATGNTVSNVFSRLADTSTIIATMLVVCGLLRVVVGRWREAAFVVLAVALQALVFVTTQLVVARARPDVRQLDPAAPTASFPSGHTSAALALYGAVAVVLLWRAHCQEGSSGAARRGSWAARVVAVLLLLVPVAVAWSRLYRGLHFPLDVAGSYVQASLAVLVSARLVLLARLPEHLTALLDHGAANRVRPQRAAAGLTSGGTGL